MNSKDLGNIVEAKVLSYFVSKGITVLVPFGDNSRYDMVIHLGNRFIRIQCKHGRLRDGVIKSNACSHNPFTKTSRDYLGEVDYFAIYNENTDKIYLYPVNKDTPTTVISLRTSIPKNGQKTLINLADDYEADKIIKLI